MMVIDPLVGFKRVVIILSVVVFPALFGPNKAKISPGLMLNEISSTTFFWLKVLLKWLT